MTSTQEFVIVGAGVAGAKAAETLRSEGFTGRVVLIGAERHAPYERPPLSKGYLQGEQDRAEVFAHPDQWFAEHDVDLRLGVGARSIDRVTQEVVLADGTRRHYDALLLATGSSPRRLAVPGSDLSAVHHLRTIDDATSLKDALASASRLVVIGAGWIGLEVAAAARGAGVAVTVLEQASLPLERVLGPEVAEVFTDLHRAHGVDLRCGVTVRALLSEGGVLTGVELEGGTVVEADTVVAGIGITPNTSIAEEAGLVVDNGILVDEHLRTSDPAIFAAVDVANAFHPMLGRHVRVEHFMNALRQGPVAARSMLGQAAANNELPFFYTDQYDLGMEYVGYTEDGQYDQVVIRGDVHARRFVALWVADRRVVAGMHANEWDATEHLDALVTSGRTIDLERLADPTIPLAEV